MGIDKKQERIIDDFKDFMSGSQNKFTYLKQVVKYGAELSPMLPEDKSEINKIKGSSVNVWLKADIRDGKVFYTGDSDSKIYKGVLGIFFDVLSGHTPEDIVKTDNNFVSGIKLYNYLPTERMNELLLVLQKIKSLAITFKKESISV